MYSLWWVVIGLGIFSFVSFLIIILVGVIYCDDDWETSIMASFGVNIIPIIAFIVCMGCSIANPIQAKREMLEFAECKEMVEIAIKNGQDLENIGITQKVIEKNEWLAKARADKKQWGNGSQYIYCDLDNLDYIIIKRENIK